MLNRASERSRTVLAEFEALLGNEGRIFQIDCDLMSLGSVKDAADAVKEKFPDGIHVLANNAGIMAFEDSRTADGLEVQMQTNQTSHFLLTKELMPLLEKGAASKGEARVVIHSSELRKGPPLETKYLVESKEQTLGGDGMVRWERYHQTKLANLLYMLGLNDRLTAKGSKVKAIAVHPGLSATQLSASSADHGSSSCILSCIMTQGQSINDGALPLIMAMGDERTKGGELWGPMDGTGGWASGYPKVHDLTAKGEPDYSAAQKDILWEGCETAIKAKFEI